MSREPEIFRLVMPSSGITLEFASSLSPVEIVEAIRSIALPGHAPANRGMVVPDNADLALSTEAVSGAMVQMVRNLAGRPRRLLEHLCAVDGPVRDYALCQVLGFGDNRQLAGSLGGISKQALKLGLQYDQIITRTTVMDDDEKHYYYQATEEMREAMNSI